jgi:diguanylate cyclase (GGDEF)-like protein/PAS domain S-box-containing protein
MDEVPAKGLEGVNCARLSVGGRAGAQVRQDQDRRGGVTMGTNAVDGSKGARSARGQSLAELWNRLVDNLFEGVAVINSKLEITGWNRAAEVLSGYSAGEMMGMSCNGSTPFRAVDGLARGRGSARVIADAFSRRKRYEGEWSLNTKTGEPLLVRTRVVPIGGIDAGADAVAVIFDEYRTPHSIRKRLAELENAAMFDPMTGLANRRLYENNVVVRLSLNKRYGWSFGVLFFDVDGLKNVNDMCGHPTGDVALKTVAEALAGHIRPFDVVSRWGGDEFAALITNVNAHQLQGIARKLSALVNRAMMHAGDCPIRKLRVSVGGTLGRPNDTPGSLLERADAAMYRIKRKHEGIGKTTHAAGRAH